jgi:hypothetical protein
MDADSEDGLVAGIVCKLCGMMLPPSSGDDFLESATFARMSAVEFAAHVVKLTQEEADRALVLRSLANCPHLRPGSVWSDAHYATGVWVVEGEPSPKKKKP